MLKGRRVNPRFSLLPSLKDVQSIMKDGVAGSIGFFGTNAFCVLLGKIPPYATWKAGLNPWLTILIDAAERVVATPIVAFGVGKVMKGRSAQVAAIGGSVSVVYHAVRDVASKTELGGSLPDWGQQMLLGVSDYAEYGVPGGMAGASGVGDYASQWPPRITSVGNPLIGAGGGGDTFA